MRRIRRQVQAEICDLSRRLEDTILDTVIQSQEYFIISTDGSVHKLLKFLLFTDCELSTVDDSNKAEL